MKLKYLFLFLFISNMLSAQKIEQATALQEEAKTLLQKEYVSIYDRLSALNILRESEQLLDNSASTLTQQNDSLIQRLLPFFKNLQNPDSLLETTRFFPDSVFQANNSYTADFKSLIGDYLALKNRIIRKGFFNFQFLNIEKSGTPITFENYWPLEVIEFEEWLNRQERELRNFPKATQAELTYNRLLLKKQDLEQGERKQNYEQNTQNLLSTLDETKAEKDLLVANNKKWRYIGFGTFAILSFLGYWLWNKTRNLLESKHQSLLEEKKRSEDLLSNILPSEVVRQLKQNKIPKAQSYHNVGVLFTDFQGFSQISKNLPPDELVNELDYCFTNFDFIIEKHHLHKIKTIGDAYMCVGGLYTRGDKHVKRMVAAALEIQEFLALRAAQKDKLGGYFFQARIGIHIGSVVAGVIGSQKMAFDVWGDTVNVAQQMEQHGEVGKVNVSQEVYELVKEQFEFIHRGAIEVKNGKKYDMYSTEK
ncbi:MAG: adenylate/guanylate cyclase domain-containing protein, partial [Bacteroidota bacterium]